MRTLLIRARLRAFGWLHVSGKNSYRLHSREQSREWLFPSFDLFASMSLSLRFVLDAFPRWPRGGRDIHGISVRGVMPHFRLMIYHRPYTSCLAALKEAVSRWLINSRRLTTISKTTYQMNVQTSWVWTWASISTVEAIDPTVYVGRYLLCMRATTAIEKHVSHAIQRSKADGNSLCDQ